LKDIESLVAKAFSRGKNFENPYEEIIDKVGVRIVVLLRSDVEIVCNLIESQSVWTYAPTRDYEKEVEELPTVFDYQSKHYILWPAKKMTFLGKDIPVTIPCELQVRTLLQHAYDEATHDTLYKPQIMADDIMHRMFARCMAMVDTSDDIFMQVHQKLEDVNSRVFTPINHWKRLYDELVGEPAGQDNATLLFLFDKMGDLLSQVSDESLDLYIRSKPQIAGSIRSHRDRFLFTQPIILPIYYLVSNQASNLKHKWPLTDSDLDVVFTELGVNSDIP